MLVIGLLSYRSSRGGTRIAGTPSARVIARFDSLPVRRKAVEKSNLGLAEMGVQVGI
ncbi:MAG: hypothetical protein ABI693_17705 [Bryobacteraceae bacterium]